jgi:hypothetical protein
MPRGKTMLAAGVAVIAVIGGGTAAALLASSGDDAGDAAPLARAENSPATEPAPAVPAAPEQPAPEAEPAPPQDEPALGADEPARAGGAPTRKTEFPRERRQQAQNDPAEKRFAIPPAREFTGTGNTTLGTVDLRTQSLVKWTTKGNLELRFGREDFPIVAPSPTGQLIVPPYLFEQVRVIARGRWRITIEPQE